MQAYFDHPAIGRSGLKECWNDPELFIKRRNGELPPKRPTEAMQFGSALDFFLTGGTLDPLEGYHVVEYPDFRTKAAKEDRDELIESGVPKDLILSESGAEKLRMESAEQLDKLAKCEAQIRATPTARDFLFSVEGSLLQEPLIWTDALTGIDCKSLPDRVIPGAAIVDLKVSAENDAEHFLKQTRTFWYDVQAFMMRTAWHANHGEWLDVVFVVVKNSEPYNVEVYLFGDSLTDHGEARFNNALAWYAECLESNRWVSRTHDQIVPLDAPRWWSKRQNETELQTEYVV